MAFVGLTGVGNINQCNRALDELRDLGIHKMRIAFDMDERTNDNVRMAKERVILAGLDKGYDITPVRWPEAYKGIDDLLYAFKQKEAENERERTRI